MKLIKLICTKCGLWFLGLRGDPCSQCGAPSKIAKRGAQYQSDTARLAAHATDISGEALICEDRIGCQQPEDLAIGRKISRLMTEDRATLIAILDGTQRPLWRKLAHAYLEALGIDSAESRNPIVPGVLYVWNQFVKESNNGT